MNHQNNHRQYSSNRSRAIVPHTNDFNMGIYDPFQDMRQNMMQQQQNMLREHQMMASRMFESHNAIHNLEFTLNNDPFFNSAFNMPSFGELEHMRLQQFSNHSRNQGSVSYSYTTSSSSGMGQPVEKTFYSERKYKNGVVEIKEVKTDSTQDLKAARHARLIDGRGRENLKYKKGDDEVQHVETLHNLTEDETRTFEKEWSAVSSDRVTYDTKVSRDESVNKAVPTTLLIEEVHEDDETAVLNIVPKVSEPEIRKIKRVDSQKRKASPASKRHTNFHDEL